VIIILCGLPIFYFGVYRISDYVVCRTLISIRLGTGISPFTIEDYIRDSLKPGISRDHALSTLKEIGSIEIIPIGSINDISTDQINLKLCTHPMNTITIFINYSNKNEVISIKIQDD
jgi:hypothetical protein